MAALEYSKLGLSPAQVADRRARYGENRLPIERTRSPWRILWNQVASPLSYVVLAAAAISLALGETGDFVLIMVVVAVDVALGFAQEYQASRTYSALRRILKPSASVLRSGARLEVEVWELVPDDVVILSRGDRVPADGIIVEAIDLTVDEAVLTGESEAVRKSAQEAADAHESKVFMGTTVLSGRGLMQVTSIGTASELGGIAASLSDDQDAPTPLQVRLEAFSRTLTRIVLVSTLVILASGVLLGRGFLEMLRTSIILAIATVPAGLLIAVTVILALGMRRILRRQGLVKRLVAVETLGSVSVICTDKTGTLTEGHMRVSRHEFVDASAAHDVMALCNNLDGPVDLALQAFLDEDGNTSVTESSWNRVAEQPFTSESKRMVVQVADATGRRRFLLKGAPESVLDMCALNETVCEELRQEIERWAGEGLRVLALAQRDDGDWQQLSGFTWVGLVGLQDPVRAAVPAAVALALDAGVEVKMITGDYARTASSVARVAGLPAATVLEGDALSRCTDEELRELVRTTSVFARVHPQDKLRIVRALQANGAVTAMIGDGVNDAPALRHADIGVVVGQASDLAKENADLILLDSDFATVVAAIEEGRVIFDNIRKMIAYVLSNSFAAVLTVFFAMLFGWPTPLLVSQILWINLICDGPSDIVLGFEPKEPGVMQRKPRALHEPVLDRLGVALIAIVSSASAAFALAAFGYCELVLHDTALGRSIVFASFAINSMVYILGFRSMQLSLRQMPSVRRNTPLLAAVIGGLLTAGLPFAIPSLGELLGVVPLGPIAWLVVALFAAALLLLVEVTKAVKRRSV